MTHPVTTLIRPVRCFICGEPMHYSGQPGHEPELRADIVASGDERQRWRWKRWNPVAVQMRRSVDQTAQSLLCVKH